MQFQQQVFFLFCASISFYKLSICNFHYLLNNIIKLTWNNLIFIIWQNPLFPGQPNQGGPNQGPGPVNCSPQQPGQGSHDTMSPQQWSHQLRRAVIFTFKCPFTILISAVYYVTVVKIQLFFFLMSSINFGFINIFLHKVWQLN